MFVGRDGLFLRTSNKMILQLTYHLFKPRAAAGIYTTGRFLEILQARALKRFAQTNH